MFIRLAMGDYAVERRSLPRYLRWRMRTRFPGGRPLHRMAVRELWGIRRARSSVLRSALEVAGELCVEPGWVRLKGNSQRRQLFGRSGREVVQLFSGEVPDSEREQRVRQQVGDLAPRILRSCASGRAWAEEWIEGRPPMGDLALRMAWGALGERLYCPCERSREEVIEDLLGRGMEPVHQHLLERFTDLLPNSLSCGQVHGDLWLGNMGMRKTGGGTKPGLVLFDWEYSRDAPLTFDVWSFVFRPRGMKPDDPAGLVRDFARALSSVGQDGLVGHAGPLACLHLLDKLTWVRDIPGRARATEVRHLGRWLQSLTEFVSRGRNHAG